jgi:hypothetical protein
MKLFDFAKNLLPSIEKNRVLEDLRITLAEIENSVLPNYSTATEFFKLNRIKSDKLKDLSDDFYRSLSDRSMKQSSFIADIYRRLPNLVENTKLIQSQIELVLESDAIREGLSAKKILLIRAAESISFLSGYMLDLLNYAYVEETALISGLTEDLDMSVVKIKHVNFNISRFAKILNEYATVPSEFRKIMTDVPEVTVNEKTMNGISGVYRESDLDPFNSGYMSGFYYNPIYHIRLAVSEWQAGRYKANKDKKKVLELRLLYLKLKAESKSDPKLEQEITYLQSRIDKIERDLKRVEEDLNEET